MFLLLLFTLTPPTLATSFFAQPFEKTLTDAPVIIRGKIGTSESRYSTYTDGTKQLFTFTEVEVKDRLKGADALPAKIEIREVGGEKNGVEMGVSGRAEFSPGEDVVVLLNLKAQDGSYPLKGLMMGKYTIEKDRGGNEVLKGAGIESSRGHSHDESESMGEVSRVWTIKALRAFIQENKSDTKMPASQPTLKQETTSIPTPSEAAEPKKEEIHEASVPESEVSDTDGNSGFKIGLKLLIGLLIGGGLYRLKRKRR